MNPAVVFIGRLCGELAAHGQVLANGTPWLQAPLNPLLATLRTDKQLLERAWSDMAIRNLLADLLRTVTKIKAVLHAPPPVPGKGGMPLGVPPNANQGLTTCRAICAELLPRFETQLAQHSPSKAKYSYVTCIGYKVKVAGSHYSGEIDDAADMQARCEDLKKAIRAAHALADRNGARFNSYVNMLKVFVAPEFFFRGRRGAYDHAVVHGGEQRSDEHGRVARKKHLGIAEIMRDELDKPIYKDWLFVLGTAIAATKFTEWKCTKCNAKVNFVPKARSTETTPTCSANPTHRVEEQTVGAYVENVGLIYKNGAFHTVTKELVSHIDYVDGATKGKVKLGSEKHDVVVDARPSGYNAATHVPTAFTDERMGGCVFTIDGITVGVEVCLDHAATANSASTGRLNHCANIQLQIIPSAGMEIGSLSTIPGGVVFNVDGLTPHVAAVGGTGTIQIQSTQFDGWTFKTTNHTAANYGGADVNKLNELNNTGWGNWTNGAKARAAAAGSGAVVMYGPFGLPKV